MKRSRLNIFLERDHERRLAQLAGFKGISKSGIVAAALDSYLSPEGADQREAAIARRLDKLTQQVERIERDQSILIETLAMFIRYTLATSPMIPEVHQEAARAQGRARYTQFVAQLARNIQRGGSLVKDVHREICPDESRFFEMPEDAKASAAAAGDAIP